MTDQEHELVMEAVTEAVLSDVTLKTLIATSQLTFAANMIRRDVARQLAKAAFAARTPPLPPAA